MLIRVSLDSMFQKQGLIAARNDVLWHLNLFCLDKNDGFYKPVYFCNFYRAKVLKSKLLIYFSSEFLKVDGTRYQ